MHISQVLKLETAAKEYSVDFSEFAGTPEEEAKIAKVGAVEAIKKFMLKHRGAIIPCEQRESIMQDGAQDAVRKFRAARKEKAYWDKVYAPKTYKKPSAEAYFNYITTVKAVEVYGVDRDGNCKMKLDEWNTEIIWQLCYYFLEDKRYAYDLDKGIILFGNVGTGKTTLFEMFAVNPRQSFLCRHAMQIAETYQKYGVDELEKYYEPQATGYPELYYGQEKLGHLFDDFGTELEKGNFGNKIHVMRDIIMARYASKKFTPFFYTHLTTNLLPDEILGKYAVDKIDADRLKRRFKEMFSVIQFSPKAPDRTV